jgi:single-strand DNA-binding protein
MEMTGRVTADANVTTTKSGKKVVNFSIAINDRYKPRDSDEWKQFTTFVSCSYWRSELVAASIKKGMLVEISGRISVSAWVNMKGEAKGTLNFHVNSIKLHGKPATATATQPADITEPVDDLPF